MAAFLWRLGRRAAFTAAAATAASLGGAAWARGGSAAPAQGGSGPSQETMQAMFDCATKGCASGKTHDFKRMFATMQNSDAAAGKEEQGGAGGRRRRTEPQKPKYVCPSKDDIGMCTWTTLHLIASKYPEVADAETQAKARGLIEGLARFYPCEYCRVDFVDSIARHPPRLATKREFVLWVCKQHNLVNKKINKPTFKCNYEALEDRWYRPCLPDYDDDDDDDEDDE